MEDRDTQIEKYLLGQLSGAEKRAFEAEMAHDSSLAAEVSDQKLIIGGLRDSRGAAGFRALLGEIEAENASEKTIGQPSQAEEKSGRVVPLGRRLFSALAIAASLALAFFGWKYFVAGASETSEQLFAANFNAPEALSLGGVRGAGQASGDSLSVALVDEADAFFKKKDFKNTHERLNLAIAAAQSPAKKSAALRTKGEVFLIEKKFEEAEGAFQQMTDETADERDWFVALAVLARPDRAGEAKVLFENYVKNPNYAGPRQDRAAKILKSMK